MNDPIDTVRPFVPEAEPSDELLARVRSDLMSTITTTEATTTTPPRSAKRRWLVPAAAAAVLATSAGAWAAIRQDRPANLSISCPADADGNIAGIRAVSGDPVADCTAEWRANHGGEPPAMTAYLDLDGNVVVKLTSDAAPEGSIAMETGPSMDTKVVQLQEFFDDLSGILATDCLDEAGARTAVQGELDRLELTTWTIAVDPAFPIGADRPCARALVLGPHDQVTLRGVPQPAPDDDPYQTFAVNLDAELASACLDLVDAEAATERIAAATDVSAVTDVAFTTDAGLLHLTSVEDPGSTCTTASVAVGGRVEVTLRGPAA